MPRSKQMARETIDKVNALMDELVFDMAFGDDLGVCSPD